MEEAKQNVKCLNCGNIQQVPEGTYVLQCANKSCPSQAFAVISSEELAKIAAAKTTDKQLPFPNA